jgi:hypothetical protein
MLDKTGKDIGKQLELQISKIRGIIRPQYTNKGLKKGEIGAPTAVHSSRMKLSNKYRYDPAYQAAYTQIPENKKRQADYQAALADEHRAQQQERMPEFEGEVQLGLENARVKRADIKLGMMFF